MFLTPDGRDTDKRGQDEKIPGVALTPTAWSLIDLDLCVICTNDTDMCSEIQHSIISVHYVQYYNNRNVYLGKVLFYWTPEHDTQ